MKSKLNVEEIMQKTLKEYFDKRLFDPAVQVISDKIERIYQMDQF